MEGFPSQEGFQRPCKEKSVREFELDRVPRPTHSGRSGGPWFSPSFLKHAVNVSLGDNITRKIK